MTYAPRSLPLACRDIAEVAAAIRKNGGRLSLPRQLVLEALFAADGPVSAEHITSTAEGRTLRLDASSVYRALEYFEELGVVRHVHLGHGPGLYALMLAGEREHLVCERCNRVTSVDTTRLDPIRKQVRELFGYDARFSHFPIIGLCEGCAESEGLVHGHGQGDRLARGRR